MAESFEPIPLNCYSKINLCECKKTESIKCCIIKKIKSMRVQYLNVANRLIEDDAIYFACHSLIATGWGVVC